MTSVRRLVATVVHGQLRRVVGACVLNSIYLGLDVLIPVLVGVVVDAVLEARGVVAVGATLVVLLVVFGVRSLSYRYGFRLAMQAQVTSGERLRHSIMRRLLFRSDRGWRAVRPGVVASVVNVDTLRISFVGFAVSQVVAAVLSFAVASVVLVGISPLLGAATVGSGLLGFVALTFAARRVSAAASDDRMANAEETALAEDICRGMRIVRGIGGTGPAGDRYRQVSSLARDAAVHSAGTVARHRGMVVAIGGVMLALGVGVGAWGVIRGDVTIGEFVTVIGLLQFLHSSLTLLGWLVSLFSQGLASFTKVVEVAGDEEPEFAEPVVDHEPGGDEPVELEFDGVVIAGTTMLRCRARPGDVIGLVVTDGAAITELFECLEGRRTVSAGRILVGGVDLAVWCDSDRRSPGTGAVAVVDGEAGVLVDTFADDVALLSRGSEMLRECVAATLTTDVLSGLAARAEQPGAQTAQLVSGGELQRLALLRALAARPAVLAMRDATTALDPATERHVMTSLARLRADGVTLVATTSPIALAATTRVLLLDGPGPPVEGRHRDLCGSARYREIVWGDRW